VTIGTVVVGGSIAGLGVATELRHLGYSDPITVIESQPHLPYDRPPLSKGVLVGKDTYESIRFHPETHYESLGITLRTATRALTLDPATRSVALSDGTTVAGAAVVVATGARARPFPVTSTSGPIHTIRELPDALAVAEALRRVERVAVIGAGFIGAEVASSARDLGCSVVMIEAATRPFAALLGDRVAGLVVDLHRRAGTRVRAGVAVAEVQRIGRSQRVLLADGSHEDADLIVAGIGAVPEVEWLAGTGLVVDGTVMCDATGRTGAPGVYAAGDVASWTDPVSGAVRRHEHWTSAREQGRVVAERIAGSTRPPAEAIPYVWSDQCGKRLQILGRPALADSVRIADHDEDRGSWLALYGRAGRLVGVAGCNAAARAMRYRPKLVDGGIPFGEA